MLSFRAFCPKYNTSYSQTYLDSSSETEDTVVCLLLRKTFEGEQDILGLFRNQIIGSAIIQSSA